MDSILRLHKVRHEYSGREVLNIPELSIPRDSITGLAGPNGSGKSTMLRILSLVENCSSGSVFFNNKEIKPFDKEFRHQLAYLPQETYLLKRTVFENIAYGLKIRGQKNGLQDSVMNALDLVGLTGQFLSRQWYELSGGESQRVALASRLVLKPACLMLDEPTASVDLESARNISRAILRARQEWGTTLVVTSHHQSWLSDICDQSIYLYNGRLLEYGYRNVLLGPWEKVDDQLSVMKMTDGQQLFVSQAPHAKSCAVLPSHAIQVSASSPPANNKQKLSGLITGIYADKQPELLSIQVVCGDQQFIITMSESELSKEGFLPNQKVFLVYQPQDIVWLP